MRKVLVASYYTGGADDNTSYPFAVAEPSNKNLLIAHCLEELKRRFDEGTPMTRVTEWTEDNKTDIALAYEHDLTGGSLDDDTYVVYFEISEVDFI